MQCLDHEHTGCVMKHIQIDAEHDQSCVWAQENLDENEANGMQIMYGGWVILGGSWDQYHAIDIPLILEMPEWRIRVIEGYLFVKVSRNVFRPFLLLIFYCRMNRIPCPFRS